MALATKLKLLTVGNTKIEKSLAVGYATAGLHLAPASLSGYNVCPRATDECKAFCLNTSGRGAMSKVQAARVRKTREFFENRDDFIERLHQDIGHFIANAEAENLTPVFRLNLTSDIRWENHNIPQAWSDYTFYDYSKISNRKGLPSNYRLTFSWSGSNADDCKHALDNGMNVAVPFKVQPLKFMGYPVCDGDKDDLRFLDPPGHIVGLSLKGSLKKNTTSPFIGDNHPSLYNK